MKKNKSKSLLFEFIAQTLSPGSSGNRTGQNNPIRLGSRISPSAGGNIISDEEEASSQISQSACVLIQSVDNGLILGVSRKNDSTAWGLPGGHVDLGETIQQAAIRELHEETGLVISDPNLIFKYEDFDTICSTFSGEVSGKINTEETGLVRWVSIQELLDGPFGAYNYALFKHIGRL